MDKDTFMVYVANTLEESRGSALPGEGHGAYYEHSSQVFKHEVAGPGILRRGIKSIVDDISWGVEAVYSISRIESVVDINRKSSTLRPTIQGYVRITGGVGNENLVGIITTNFKTVTDMEGNCIIKYGQPPAPNLRKQTLETAIPELFRLYHQLRRHHQ